MTHVPPPPLCPDDAAVAWLRERGISAPVGQAREKALEMGWIPPAERAVVPAAGRDAKGRFASGWTGRPKGARNKITRQIEEMLAELAPAAIQLVAEHVRHDIRIALWILQNFARPPGHHIELTDLPTINDAADVPSAISAIIGEIGKGELSLEEGQTLIRVVSSALETLASAHRMRGGLMPPPPP